MKKLYNESGLWWFTLFLRSVLEKNLRLLMECVDEMSQDANRYFSFQRQLAKQNQAKTQYQQKRVRTDIMLTLGISLN